MGFEIRQYRSKSHYFFLEVGGALGGDVDGYAEVLLGAGCRLKIAERVFASAGLSAGAAGGGRVETGGGAVARGTASLDFRVGTHLSAGLEGGYLWAPVVTFPH